MKPLPDKLLSQYHAALEQQDLPHSLWPHYRKWLCYFLDFCDKYPTTGGRNEQMRLFLQKLTEKNRQQHNASRLPMRYHFSSNLKDWRLEHKQ